MWIPGIVITEEIPEIYQALISNNFQQGDFECEICFDDKEGFLCHRMSNCGHVFCQVQGFTDDQLHIFRSSSGKPWLGVPFWLLFIPNSRWRHKSYLSKRGLRRTNITTGYWAACKWRRFLEIRSTSVSKDGFLRILGPTRLLPTGNAQLYHGPTRLLYRRTSTVRNDCTVTLVDGPQNPDKEHWIRWMT